MELIKNSKARHMVKYFDKIKNETGINIHRGRNSFYLRKFCQHFTGSDYDPKTIKKFFPGFKSEYMNKNMPIRMGNIQLSAIEPMCEGCEIPSVIEFIKTVNEEHDKEMELKYIDKEINYERPRKNLLCEFKKPDEPLTINHLNGKKIYVDALGEDDDIHLRKVTIEPFENSIELTQFCVRDDILYLIYVFMSLDLNAYVLINSKDDEPIVENICIDKVAHKKYFSYVKIGTMNVIGFSDDVQVCKLPDDFIETLENETPSNQIMYNIQRELDLIDPGRCRIEYNALYIIYALIGHVFEFSYQTQVGRYKIDCVIKLRNSGDASYSFCVEVNENFHASYERSKIIQRKKFLDINNTYLYDLNVLRKINSNILFAEIYSCHINEIVEAYESVFCIKDPHELKKLLKPKMLSDGIDQKIIDIYFNVYSTKIFDDKCSHIILAQLCGYTDDGLTNYRPVRNFITKTFEEEKDYIIKQESDQKKIMVLTREAFICSLFCLSDNKVKLARNMIMGYDIFLRYLDNTNTMVRTYSPDEIKEINEAEEDIDRCHEETQIKKIDEMAQNALKSNKFYMNEFDSMKNKIKQLEDEKKVMEERIKFLEQQLQEQNSDESGSSYVIPQKSSTSKSSTSKSSARKSSKSKSSARKSSASKSSATKSSASKSSAKNN